MCAVPLERGLRAPEGRTAELGARSRPYPGASTAARVLHSRTVLQRCRGHAYVRCSTPQALHEQRSWRVPKPPAAGAFAGRVVCCGFADGRQPASCALTRWAVRAAKSVAHQLIVGAVAAAARLGARSLRYTQRDDLRDVRPTGVKCVVQPTKRKGAVSRPQRSRNACHQQRPARRAHNRLQEALFIVSGGILHHARILRVVRNEARHPGAPPAAPLMLLVDRPSYARDAPMTAMGTCRVCASAGSPCERRGGEQVHVRQACSGEYCALQRGVSARSRAVTHR